MDSLSNAAAALRELAKSNNGVRLPSERDLAARFGVSRPRVREILLAMQEEGLIVIRQGSGSYGTNKQSKEVKQIVLLIDSSLKISEDPFVSRVVEDVMHEAQVRHLHCTLQRISSERMPLSAADAVILLGQSASKVIEELDAASPPAVTLFLDSTHVSSARISYLQLDDFRAGCLAAKELIDQGCTSLLFAGRLDVPASKNRFEGAKAAAESANASLTFQRTQLNYLSGITTGVQLDITDDVTGVIATNDWLALGIRAGLASRSDRKSAHIVSFDGLSITEGAGLNIRSLTVPIEEVVKDAFDEIYRLASVNKPSGRTIVYSLRWPTTSSE